MAKSSESDNKDKSKKDGAASSSPTTASKRQKRAGAETGSASANKPRVSKATSSASTSATKSAPKVEVKASRSRKPTDESADVKSAVAAARSDSSFKSALNAAVAVSKPKKAAAIPGEPQKDELGRSYATGRRKTSVARVRIRRGKGNIIVNGKEVEQYFARPVLQMIINQPFAIADRSGQFDVDCLVEGGGLSGQAGAVRHGISRALTLFEPGLRKPLKVAGMLTRDSRVVERKKYGLAKARRRFQFSKR